jgi:RNase P subunit RPR2
MSQARICDKCKKVLVCNPSAKIEIDFGYYGEQHYELCEDCKKILVRWLTERKNDGT